MLPPEIPRCKSCTVALLQMLLPLTLMYLGIHPLLKIVPQWRHHPPLSSEELRLGAASAPGAGAGDAEPSSAPGGGDADLTHPSQSRVPSFFFSSLHAGICKETRRAQITSPIANLLPAKIRLFCCSLKLSAIASSKPAAVH